MMLVLNKTFSTNNITNLMVYHPHLGTPYQPDLILHGEERYQSKMNPNATILPWGKHENEFL